MNQKQSKKFKNVLSHAEVYVYDNNSNDNTDKLAKDAGAIVDMNIIKVRAML